MSNTVQLTIDDQLVTAPEGQKILHAALEHGIAIPHLCARPEMPLPFGGCRLCFVEVEGWREPVTSCTEPVREGLVVRTRSAAVDRLVARSFQLILSTHPVRCKGCPANHNCALQAIAKQRGLKLNSRPLPRLWPELPLDHSRADFAFDPNRCILCGQCVYLCNDIEQAHALDFVHRGMQLRVSTAGDRPLAESSCTGCLRCVKACPVGAFWATTPQ